METEELVETASRRAHQKHRWIPGNILEQDDYRQVGHLYLWLMRDRLQEMSSGMLFTILIRRMVDYGRRCMGSPRSGGVEFVSVDMWYETQPKDPMPSQLDTLIAEEEQRIAEQLQSLLMCGEVGLTSKQLTALQLYFIEGLTLAAAGERCGVGETIMCRHVNQGLEQVRLYLAEAA